MKLTVDLLKSSVSEWNDIREESPREIPDLRGADLRGADLRGAKLRVANLREANLTEANLTEADLRVANLTEAELRGADLRGADLRVANLSGTNLREADLTEADLSGTNLRGAELRGADLRGAFISNVVGNGKEIKSLRCFDWIVTWTKGDMAIGCMQFSIKRWLSFSEEEITNMDKNALDFYKKHKNDIINLVNTTTGDN